MKASAIVEPRTYRDLSDTERFKTFRVTVETSDLYIRAHRRLDVEAKTLVLEARMQVQKAIARRPEFLSSLEPLLDDSHDAPVPARMVYAGRKARTGPLAAVAGAIAEYVGRGLLEWSDEVVLENGGDIFLKVYDPVTVGIYAGDSPFSGKLGLKVDPGPMPIGVCTSAATVGPSLSLGRADAATVISRDVALGDAVATALGNRITQTSELKAAVQWAVDISGVEGALAILGDKIAAVGSIELIPLSEEPSSDENRQ